MLHYALYIRLLTPQIRERLDYYAQSIREVYPDIDGKSPREKATCIARHLLAMQWVGIREGSHYHALDHMFLAISLHSRFRNGLPLLAAVIYTGLCRRFNLRAAPCSFPFHVHCVVKPPEGFDLDGNAVPIKGSQHMPWDSSTDTELSENSCLFMDPYHSSDPIPLSSMDEQLRFIARRHGGGSDFPDEQRATFLAPATPRELCLRNAHNILRHEDYGPPPPQVPIDKVSALYGALWCLVLLDGRNPHSRQYLGHLIQIFIEHFSYDLPMIESQALPLGVTHGIPREQLISLCADLRRVDTQVRTPKLRSDIKNKDVKFKVGQIFRHRIRGYLAVVCGWDPNCDMAEEWITMNQVNRLERGRHQPFYNVL